MSIVALIENLKKIPEKLLSNQSKEFITLSTDHQIEYLENNFDVQQKNHPEIACIATLKMSSVDKYSVSCLVIGSEDGDVIVLDPQTYTQLISVRVFMFLIIVF